MLAVRILGCSGTYAGPGGACSGYLIESNQARVWLDAGPGTLSEIQLWCGLSELDAIVLTHCHPDHWLELPIVANALRYHVSRDPLPVFGNSTTRQVASGLIGASKLDAVFDWTIVDSDTVFEVGDQRWSFTDCVHYVPTVAPLVVAGGRSIFFSADTGPGIDPTPTLEAAGIDNVDLALIESTFDCRPDGADFQHLSAGEAGVLADRLGANKLVLTHHSPGQDSDTHLRRAAEIYSGSIVTAVPGTSYSAIAD